MGENAPSFKANGAHDEPRTLRARQSAGARAGNIACNSHALGKTSSSMRDEEPSTRLINQGF
jgi:hypothetical protein